MNRLKAFVSYAKEDEKTAMEVYSLLDNHGLDTWIDKVNLLPGQDWELEIHKAIKNCSYFIACLSENSVSKKGYVQKELKIAFSELDLYPDEEIFVIPIRFDNCKVPLRLSGKQWLDWWSDGSERKLLLTLGLIDNPPFYKAMIQADKIFERDGIIGIINSIPKEHRFILYMAGRGLHHNPNSIPDRMYTLVDYLNKNKKRCQVQIDNTDNFLKKLREDYGLGDWNYFVRRVFSMAIRSLSREQRAELFNIDKILSEHQHGSMK